MPLPFSAPRPGSLAADAMRGASDVVAMLTGITTDPRVPQAAKLEASAALAYLASGRGRIPSFVPGLGRLDDLAVAAFALRRLLAAAGEPVLLTYWRGSDRALDRLLSMTTALASPAGRWRQLAVAGTAVSFAREQLSRRGHTFTRPPARRPRAGFGKIVDGEVLARREERR